MYAIQQLGVGSKLKRLTLNIVVVLHDAHNFYTKRNLSSQVLKALKVVDKNAKTVLALNKVDLVKNKDDLLALTRKLVNTAKVQTPTAPKKKNLIKLFDQYDLIKELENIQQGKEVTTSHAEDKQEDETSTNFDEVFMISALNGTGVPPLKKYLLAQAKKHEWMYDDAFITDQSIEEIITLCVKEKVLDFLTEEIPYNVTPLVDFVSQDDVLNIQVSIGCATKRIASSLMGKKGMTIRAVALAAEQSLAEAFGQPVRLRVIIKQAKGSGIGRVTAC